MGHFLRVKKHLPHCKVYLYIVVNNLRMKVSIIYPHQSTKDDIVYLIGLNVTEMNLEAGGYLELPHERVYQGLIHHENLKARRMRVPQEMERDLGQKQLEEMENEDSREA